MSKYEIWVYALFENTIGLSILCCVGYVAGVTTYPNILGADRSSRKKCMHERTVPSSANRVSSTLPCVHAEKMRLDERIPDHTLTSL